MIVAPRFGFVSIISINGYAKFSVLKLAFDPLLDLVGKLIRR